MEVAPPTVMQIASAKQRLPRWATFAGLAVVHLGALCALIPGTFHWSALIVMTVLYYTTGAWGISMPTRAESDASRCLGTEVSVLTVDTHVPRRGLPWAAPSPGSSFPLPTN